MGWQDDPIAQAQPAAPAGGWQDDPVAQPAQPAAPSAPLVNMAGLKRGTGLASRDILEGLLSLPKLGANLATGAANAVVAGADKVNRFFNPGSDQFSHRFPYQGDAVSDLIGLPKPQTPTEQTISNLTRPIYGAAGGIGIGGAIPGPVGSALSAQPVQQLVAGATGGAASEATRQAGGGDLAQFFAGLLGGASPSLLASGVPAAAKSIARGGASAQQVQDSIDAFRELGTSPSVGQATQSRMAQGTESLLTRIPGSAGVMAKASTAQAQDLGAGVEALASKLSPKASAEQAGRAISKSITGDGGFTDTFKVTQGALYDKLDEFIPPQQRVDVSNARDKLEALTASIPGAPNVSRFFRNAKINDIKGALEADTQGAGSVAANPELPMFSNLKSLSSDDQALVTGLMADAKLPYEAVKKLRTLVGNQLSDWTITSDVPRSQWKGLYGALSEDLKSAAKMAGPDATQAWNRANWFTRAGMGRLDTLSSVVDKAGGPEKVFAAATSGTKEGATTLRAVMQSLPSDGQKMLSAAVIRRLGRATPGQQNQLGDKFSTETFLTNWNTLSNEAKATLFDRYGPKFRASMDNVARVASNLRAGSKVWQNPSGTSQAAAQATAAATFFSSLFTGHFGVATGVAAAAGGANLNARLMTNPNFVRWLSTTTSKPASAVPALLNQLAQQGRVQKDQDLIDAAGAFSDGLETPAGLKKRGNLDPYNRKVLHNQDGTISTTSSISIGTDSGEVLIPTVVDGVRLSKKDAIAHYWKTGENLGTFDTPDNADTYATALHNEQARRLGLGRPN